MSLEYGTVIDLSTLAREDMRPGVRRMAVETPDMTVLVNELQVGMDINPHRHPDLAQLAWIVEGTVDYYIDGEAHRMGPGSMILVPPGAEHYSIPIEGPVLNVDLFAPRREDISYLAELSMRPLA